jgi:hypothetical protein
MRSLIWRCLSVNRLFFAAKEIFEETGLLVEIGPFLFDAVRSRSVCRYFLARRISGDPSDMGKVIRWRGTHRPRVR